MVKLSKRMQAIADYIIATDTVVDVGTDHGFLPIYLVENKICKHAIAMDINQGPLERAKEHIEESKLTKKIQTRRSDGLESLKQKEAQVMIIAGMGGPLMMRILQNGKDIASCFDEIVLQPQSELEEFRKFLYLTGYEIVDETMVLEEGKYYTIWKVIPGLFKNEDDYWKLPAEVKRYGKPLIMNKNIIFKQFLCKEEQVCRQIQKELDGGIQLDKRAIRLKEVEERLRIIETTIRQMQ